jgi:hypothetical protein
MIQHYCQPGRLVGDDEWAAGERWEFRNNQQETLARCVFDTRTLVFNNFRPDYQPKNTSVNLPCTRRLLKC